MDTDPAGRGLGIPGPSHLCYSRPMTDAYADSEIRTKGSLCSGTGALDRATPGRLQWVAENNPAAGEILKRENPDVPNLIDITSPDFRPGYVDLLTSGDPCQSMSAAGRQEASADHRFLWPFVIDTIRRVQPREIFLENVQNITSVALVKGGEKGSVLKMRLDDLREAGYAVKWMILGACSVGAPHHRHRWFLRARYVGLGAPEAVRIISKCGAPRGGGRVILPTPRARDWKGGSTLDRPIDGGPDLPTVISLLPTPTTADGKGGPGKSANGHDGYNLRTAVHLLPTPVVSAGSRGGPQDPDKRQAGGRSVNLQDAVHPLLPTPRATDIGTEGRRSSDGWRPQLGQAVRESWGKFEAAVALWEQTIGRPAPDPTIPAPRGGRRLNPALSEWMMGYPAGYLTDHLDRNDALRCAGNGVVQLQAEAAWSLLG